ncbi:MAG: 50S ribosomal protein L31 [Gammaproteobacteria bacterium GWE2_42_36]|nr:MAG: 50S ribosomal protein L31 [Gammaproteobacteria bacterium GWE2_42_36]HCU05082.1 50S ribosomal protein L31 [Coxiellaceae bacterium]
MQTEIHPAYDKIKVVCSCGNKFETRSTLSKEKNSLNIEVCDKCHPFYSGQQKIIDTAGRVEKFKQKYKMPESKAKKEEASKDKE